MNQVKSTSVHDLLAEFLEMDPSRQCDFLADTRIDPAIRKEVELIASLKDDAAKFLTVSAPRLSDDFFDSSEDLSGLQLGNFILIRELGTGGMGTVYLAERSDKQFDQRVAIKILRREFDTQNLRDAFARELANQARLIHPNIAAIIDAGTTEGGRPYIVMELVTGLPIDKYCSKHRLSLKSRLKLFNKVCDSVGFAHRNLIVHGDLKPSNILITDEGVPKLLDFGISQLIDPNRSSGRKLDNLALTPAYASPQRLAGEQVSTTSDIYSLGVILDKLIAGLPHETHSKPTFTRRILPATPAPASSDRIGAAGELNSIVCKAVDPNEGTRYNTAGELADDIWRFVDGYPLAAYSNSGIYRLSKFVRRKKLLVLSALLITFSLIAGLSAAIWQARTARAQAEWAITEKQRAEKISRFMMTMISYANPHWYAKGSKFGRDARVIDALNDLGEQIDVEFAGQPDIQSELHHKFSEAYIFNRGGSDSEFMASRQKYHSARALELRKQFYGEWHELVAKDLFYRNMSEPVDSPHAIETLSLAIRMMRDTNPRNLNLPYMLEAYVAYVMLPQFQQHNDAYLNNPAIVLPGENKYQVGERLLAEALPVLLEHYKDNEGATRINRCWQAFAQIKQGKMTDAEPNIEICRKHATPPSVTNPTDPDLELIEAALRTLSSHHLIRPDDRQRDDALWGAAGR